MTSCSSLITNKRSRGVSKAFKRRSSGSSISIGTTGLSWSAKGSGDWDCDDTTITGEESAQSDVTELCSLSRDTSPGTWPSG